MAALLHDSLVFKVFNPRTPAAQNQLLSTHIQLGMGTSKLNGFIIHMQFNQPSTEFKSKSPFNRAGFPFSFLLPADISGPPDDFSARTKPQHKLHNTCSKSAGGIFTFHPLRAPSFIKAKVKPFGKVSQFYQADVKKRKKRREEGEDGIFAS